MLVSLASSEPPVTSFPSAAPSGTLQDISSEDRKKKRVEDRPLSLQMYFNAGVNQTVDNPNPLRSLRGTNG
jgi:hypothetical protein